LEIRLNPSKPESAIFSMPLSRQGGARIGVEATGTVELAEEVRAGKPPPPLGRRAGQILFDQP